MIRQKTTRTTSDVALSTQGTLTRQLTFAPLFFIVVGNMIGTGIFTTSGFIIHDVEHPLAMLLCWFLGGCLALCGALCYAELGAMFPSVGGDYVFLRESFGKRAAFLSGWISLWVGFSAPIAAAAMAFGAYFARGLPLELQAPWVSSTLAVSAIVLFTWVHASGLLFGSRVQSALTLLKIVLLLGLITAATIWGSGSLAHFQAAWTPSSVLSERFATSLIFVSFAYSGWNAAAYLGGEIEDAGRNLPNSIIAGTLFVTVLYLLLNVIYVYAVSPSEMRGVAEIGALAAAQLFGQATGALFGFLIAFFLLSTLSAMIMTGPRVYYAMGRDGVFFPLFGAVDEDRHIPRAAILLQAGIAILLVLTSTFESLLIYIGFLLSLFASLTVLGMMKIRIREPARYRAYRAAWFPLPPVLFVLGNLWIVLFSLRGNLTTFLWGGVTVLLGLVAYEVERRRSARA